MTKGEKYRAYYEANKQKILEANRERAKERREKLREADAETKAKHREKLREKEVKHRTTHNKAALEQLSEITSGDWKVFYATLATATNLHAITPKMLEVLMEARPTAASPPQNEIVYPE